MTLSSPGRRRQTLDGGDLVAVGLHREHQAGTHRLAIDQHGAGAADAVLAAGMRAVEQEILAQHIEQRLARLDIGGPADAVDAKLDFHRAALFSARAPASVACLFKGAHAKRDRDAAAIGGAGMQVARRVEVARDAALNGFADRRRIEPGAEQRRDIQPQRAVADATDAERDYRDSARPHPARPEPAPQRRQNPILRALDLERTRCRCVCVRPDRKPDRHSRTRPARSWSASDR